MVYGFIDTPMILQLYQSCFPTDRVPLNIRFMGCLEAIKSWMTRNRLKLNAAKTDRCMCMGFNRRLKNSSPPEVVLLAASFRYSSQLRSLGVIIDTSITFSDHVTRLVATCFYQSCGRFDPSVGPWRLFLLTPSSGLSYLHPDSIIVTACCPVFQRHCSNDWTV